METIRYYVENNAREIIIWHPAYSKLIDSRVKEKMECSFEELSKFTTRMRKTYKKPINLLPDLLQPCWLNIQEIMDFTQNLGKSNVLWLVSEAGKEYLKTNSHIDLALVPKAPFDAAGQDLLYTPYYKIEEELGCEVKVV